jgi:uncharacterized protein
MLMPGEEKSYFVDTNILMYAAGKEHEYKKICLKVLKDIGSYENIYYINTEVLQEILYRYGSIGMRNFGIKLAENVIELFSHILQIDEKDIYLAVSIMKNYENLLSRDAVIIANMLNKGIRNIISVDKDFDRIREISRIDPGNFKC